MEPGKTIPKAVPPKLAERVDYWDDEIEIGNGVIIMLKGGYNFDGEHGLHVLGGDSATESIRNLRDRSFPCPCELCK